MQTIRHNTSAELSAAEASASASASSSGAAEDANVDDDDDFRRPRFVGLFGINLAPSVLFYRKSAE